MKVWLALWQISSAIIHGRGRRKIISFQLVHHKENKTKKNCYFLGEKIIMFSDDLRFQTIIPCEITMNG